MAGIVTSNKTRKLVGNRLKEIDVPTTTLNTALYYADLTAQGASYTDSHVNAELNAYPTVVKNNASLALTPSANKAGVVYAMNGDSKTLEEFEFQRGSSGTYFDASGVMQLAAANVPRINFDAGISKGLLIEPASSNLVLWSGMGNYGTFGAFLFEDRVRCSNVTESGLSCVKINGTSPSLRLASIVLSPNKMYTYSFWIKAATAFTLQLRNFASASSYNNTTHPITTNWQRITKSFTVPAGSNNDILHFYKTIVSENLPDLFIADIQLEEGPVATSYIPTTTAIATRLADKVLSKRPTAVFNKNSINVKTAEWPATWMGNGMDKLSISGKNLLKNSNSSTLFTGFAGSSVTRYSNIEVPEWGAKDASRIVTSGGTDVIRLVQSLTIPALNTKSSLSGWFRNNGASNIAIHSNLGASSTTLAPGEAKKIEFLDISGNGSTSLQFQARVTNVADVLDLIWWRLKFENKSTITAWQPAPEDYVKVDVNGNIEISYTEPIHLQQFSLISRELKQEEV
ncbi:phage head spike fiber domain-containing protein [Sphingobacterium bovisgrunnientis]|uniref:phage head spike fiber domain-containing protein n=1 Tax=Sphingobacterium bovisgrunnientis TaxID=1874697 RepID=UPI0013574BC7|nr:hypothetical protein [Sphingobacterium bovisgrunnientis]